MSSIFEEAGKAAKQTPKTKESTPAKGTHPPTPEKTKEELDYLIANPGSIKMKDVDGLIIHLREIHDNIEKQLDDIYQKSGLSPTYIKNYLSNPNNFSEAQWEQIQRDRQALMSNLMGAPKVETPEEKRKKEAQTSDKASKERRGKMIGNRRNWIPMH